jgi:hypothetical protein
MPKVQTRVIGIRLTLEQIKVIESKAGIMSVSEYCKFVVLREATRSHDKKGN